MEMYQKCSLTVTNENWKGKNDPVERRRIQNRINQRAFRHRQRQREGESARIYQFRAISSDSPPPRMGMADEQTRKEGQGVVSVLGRQLRDQFQADLAIVQQRTDSHAARHFDVLAHLINRNFHAAALANARELGIDQLALQQLNPILTPRREESVAAPDLIPVALQYRILHDPIIDIIPHPRLRHNMISAIASTQFDAKALSAELRGSGALIHTPDGMWQRCGLVVSWSSPHEVQSWEVSVGFMRRWGFLLQGCEDLLTSTNVWRAQRGESMLFRSMIAIRN